MKKSQAVAKSARKRDQVEPADSPEESHFCAPPFDPFDVLPKALQGSKALRSRYMLWGFALAAIMLSVPWVIEGTLGSAHDFQPIQDFQRAFSFGHPVPSTAQFPFLRDLPSWVLLSVLILTITCVHHQWRLFSVCIQELANGGALTPKSEPTLSRRQKFWCERVARLGPDCTFDSLINWMNRKLNWVSRMSAVWLLASLLLAILLARGERAIGMFEIVDRPGSTSKALLQFSRTSYAGWWASSSHPIGSWVYVALVALGIYVILIQNVVGVAAVAIAGLVTGFFDTGVDWFDRDGSYGWRPLGNVYRTVRWGLGMDGIAFSMLFIIVGIGEWHWMSLLFALWIIALPIYLGIPSLVFRHVGRQAKDSALDEVGELSLTMSENRVEALERASQAVPYIRGAAIRPLRLSRIGPYALVVAVVLPTLLAILEIFSQWTFRLKR